MDRHRRRRAVRAPRSPGRPAQVIEFLGAFVLAVGLHTAVGQPVVADRDRCRRSDQPRGARLDRPPRRGRPPGRAFLAAGSAPRERGAGVSAAAGTEAVLGETLTIDDRTVLVLGQELDVPHDQPDVANALVHRSGDTLVAHRHRCDAAVPRRAGRGNPPGRDVDARTGADHARPPRPRRQQRPRRRAGCAGGALRARPRPRADARPGAVLGAPRSPGSPAWCRCPRRRRWRGTRSCRSSQPLRPFGATTRIYEERPLERIRIGSARFTGWTFADGAVRVLRSQGHCAGHVDRAPARQRRPAPVGRGQRPLRRHGRRRPAQDPDHARRGGRRCSRRARPPSSPTGTRSPSADGDGGSRPTWTGCSDQATALQEAALALAKDGGRVRPDAFTAATPTPSPSSASSAPTPTRSSPRWWRQPAARDRAAAGRARDAPWSRPALANPAPVAGHAPRTGHAARPRSRCCAGSCRAATGEPAAAGSSWSP